MLLNKTTWLGLGMLATFVSGLLIGLDYNAKKYQAEIAQIQRNHAQDIAEQISMEAELLAQAQAEQQDREKQYVKAMHLLNQKLYQQQQNLQLQQSELQHLEKHNEKVRDLGALPTPDAIVDWLR